MKKILMILVMGVLVTKINCYSQDYSFPKNNEGEDEFSEVITTNISKDAMFANAQEWIAKTFGDYKSVIQFENKDEGKLIIKGISKVSYPQSNTIEKINYTITIECKDNRYKYTISDIQIFVHSYIVGGTREFNYDITHEQHRVDIQKNNNSIDYYNVQIDSLNNIKKQTNKIEESIENYEQYKKGYKTKIEESMYFYKSEYDSIFQLIESLKKSMQKNNNW